MSFIFGGLKTTSTKKEITVDTVKQPLQFKKGNGEISFIMGEALVIPFEKTFPQIPTWIETCFKSYTDKDIGYSIFCGLETKSSTVIQPLENDIYETYYRNSWSDEDLAASINAAGKYCPFVFAVGRGLYSITKSSDLQTQYFYDAVFNKTYFYSPALDKFVFPIDSFNSLLRRIKMNFKTKDPREMYTYHKVLVGNEENTIVADVFDTNFAQFQINYALTHWKDLEAELHEIKTWKPLKYEASENENHSMRILDDLIQSKIPYYAYDLETSGFDFLRDEIGDLSVANTRSVGYHIPWAHVLNNMGVAERFARLNKDKKAIGANLKFDLKFSKRSFYKKNPKLFELVKDLKVDYDVNQGGHILNEMRSNSLKTLAWMYTPYGGYDKDLEDYKRIHPWLNNYLKIPNEVRIPYSAYDSAVTIGVHEEQMKQFDQIARSLDREDGATYTLKQYYTDILMPVTNMFADIEYEGLYVNVDKMLQNEKEVKEIMSKLEKEIKEELFSQCDLPMGYDFDLSSPTQLGKFLEEKVMWPCLGRSKNKLYSTGDEQLVKWAHMGYKVASKISDYRTWGVALKTFTGDVNDEDGWWQHVRKHEEDDSDRIHADFMPGRAESGRNRCTRPNLQNIPARGAISKKIKGVICPPSEDYVIGSVDFDSLQLKLATIQSGDPTLVDFYMQKENKVDLHSLTAYKIFGQRLFEVSYINIEDAEGNVHKRHAKEEVKVQRASGEKEVMTLKDYMNKQEEGDLIEIK